MGRWLRAGVFLVVGYLSGLFALGCALAVLFEIQGFGGPRDQGPRPLYLIALAVGFVLCVAALPLTRSLLARWQTPNRRTGPDTRGTPHPAIGAAEPGASAT